MIACRDPHAHLQARRREVAALTQAVSRECLGSYVGEGSSSRQDGSKRPRATQTTVAAYLRWFTQQRTGIAWGERSNLVGKPMHAGCDCRASQPVLSNGVMRCSGGVLATVPVAASASHQAVSLKVQCCSVRLTLQSRDILEQTSLLTHVSLPLMWHA